MNESFSPFEAFRGKRVLITGHTGFKGSWLSLWLAKLGADVHGYALEPPTNPSLFEQTGLASLMHHRLGDVRDQDAVLATVREIRPDFVFHMAAQPLVRLSYREPVATYSTNVMGTVNVLDALRRRGEQCIAIIVTSDKCYENREWVYGYRENDPMGGYDPYSSSKGAAELAVAAYGRSYFSELDSPVGLASVRAGNVIGGGDWALDRIVPDCMRALREGKPILVRNKRSTRPWQHVLEPLGGYLLLAAEIARARDDADKTRYKALCSPFNFGPQTTSNCSVGDLVGEILRHWPGTWNDASKPGQPHEAGLLNLSTDKAYRLLGWKPIWNFAQTMERTVTWYRDLENCRDSNAVLGLTAGQIDEYSRARTA